MEIAMRSSTPIKKISHSPAASTKKPTRCCLLSPLLLIALSGCATFQKCDSNACADDAKITSDVQARLQQQPDLERPDLLNVQTKNHVVYLSGSVSAGLESREAESVALEAPGVTRVVNSIYVTK
jgi:osmotically-inducible protein OsmY